MKSLTVEISWMGLTNYDEEDIGIALGEKFKSSNFSVKRVVPSAEHDYQESIILDLEKLPEDKTSFTIDYKKIH